MSIWDSLPETSEEDMMKYAPKEPPVDPAIAERYQLRVRLVAFSKSGCTAMMKYLRDNADSYRKAGYSEGELKELRDICERGFSQNWFYVGKEDMAFVNSLFGKKMW